MSEKEALGPIYEERSKIDPKDADIAFASIDQYGNEGDLNKLVLERYGHSTGILKKLNLELGQALIKGKKTIILVVTVGKEKTAKNVRTNLFRAIKDNLRLLAGHSVWLPLMGTGSGRLSLQESYNITTGVLENLRGMIVTNGIFFNISIPYEEHGKLPFDRNNGSLQSKIGQGSSNPIDVSSNFESLENNYGGSLKKEEFNDIVDFNDSTSSYPKFGMGR